MKSYFNKLLDKYVYSDDLDFGSRVANLLFLAAMFGLSLSLIGHLILRSHWTLLIVKVVMVAGAFVAFIVLNKYKLHRHGHWLAAIGYCNILYPLAFITNGGSHSGFAAYFVATIFFIVLLSSGRLMWFYLTLHVAVIISCYLLDYFMPQIIVPLNTFQYYADIVFSVVLSGLILGIVIKGLSALFVRERQKTLLADKAKGDFLAQMSHEIRTPMNTIIGITSILSSSTDIWQHKRELPKIEAASNHLLGIINDILNMSKIESGKLELNLAEYSTAKLIGDIVSLNVIRIGSKPINFILDIDETLPARLHGDELRIKQILNNLLSNAIKYTESGHIKLSMKHTKDDAGVLLSIFVEDTGRGISSGDLKHLFSEFQRFDTPSPKKARNADGLGLSLGITKKLAELMGGNISVQSEIGVGSTFFVNVRQKAVGDAAIGRETARSLSDFTFVPDLSSSKKTIDKPQLPDAKVLVVDDISVNLYVVRELLKTYGIAAETVSSGLEAIDKVKKGAVYDIILMDQMMPVMSGIEATKELRGLGYTGKIIAFTANALTGSDEMFKENGFDGFIPKPMDESLLQKYLAEL